MAVLAECLCHRKQSVKNKVCSTCGEDLVKLRRSNKLRYWITYRLPDGRQCRQSVGSFEGLDPFSITDARDALAKRKIQRKENRLFDIKPECKMTFQDLTKWYLGLESVKYLDSYYQITNDLRKFNSVFGNRIISDITPSELDDYKVKRKREGLADSTIDQEIGYAKTAINKAFNDDLVGGDVLKRFKRVKKYLTGKKRNSNARKRILMPVEFVSLVEHAPAHLKPILWTAYNTGMREGEILNLTWEKVLLKECLIKLRPEDTKDDEAREVPISNELHEILNRLPRGIQGDYPVFTYKGKPIVEDIRTGLKKACERAGILYGRFEDGGFVFHDLRRTFITDMRRAGVDQAVTMEITGHSRKETIDRYNQVTMDDMKQAVEKLVLYRRDQTENVDQNVDQVAILGDK